jgi:hypothetical protein
MSAMREMFSNIRFGHIRFQFPEVASSEEIEYTKNILALQISSWERWNKQRELDERWNMEFSRWQNDGGRS